MTFFYYFTIIIILIQCERLMLMYLMREMFMHNRTPKYDYIHDWVHIPISEEIIYDLNNIVTISGLVQIFIDAIKHRFEKMISFLSMIIWFLILRLISLFLFFQPDPSTICQTIGLHNINFIIYENLPQQIVFLIQNFFNAFSLTQNKNETYLTCCDMMFSGHTTFHLLILFYLYDTKSGSFMIYAYSSFICIMMLVINHIHYTWDIIIAFIVSCIIICLHNSRKIKLKYYHSYSSNSDKTPARIFFDSDRLTSEMN